MQNEHPKLKIMTYDDVYENAQSVGQNLLGPLVDVGAQTYYLGKVPFVPPIVSTGANQPKVT